MSPMTPVSHDPREHIRGIHQILISDKKRIGFLFGAGSSFATGLKNVRVPAIAEMTDAVVAKANAHSTKLAAAIESIRAEIDVTQFTVESLLSSIEAKRSVIGNGQLNGLDSGGFAELAALVKTEIVELVSVHDALVLADRKALAHSKLASWIAKARRRYPAELFTTNYDYLFEIAIEGLAIPYFDGFAGTFEPFFCPEAVEDIGAYQHLVKLWKMHGSLGWAFRDQDKAVVRRQGASPASILIFPSHLKYNSAKKQPYVGLIDRLCTFLQQDDAVLFTCGYSFGDNHINERIVTSLRRGANSNVFALYYDEYLDSDGKLRNRLEDESDVLRVMATSETGGKMSALGLRHAVIGGRFGKWQLREEPRKDESIRIGQYFDEDAVMPDAPTGQVISPDQWRGTGRFRLPDFRALASFLDELSSAEAPATGAELV